MWWNSSGILNQRNDIIIPDGNYSISSLSDFLHYQMLLRGHYVVNSQTNNKMYFISFTENPAYYATEFSFLSMFAKGTADAGTNYINENPPSQIFNSSGNLINIGWDFPATAQYPQLLFDDATKTLKDFFGINQGIYPPIGTPVSHEFDMLGQVAPFTYPVSAINIQSNFCRSNIAIPDNILYSFSQGNSAYGDLINIEPKNLIWISVPDGTYSQLELQFIDQDFNPMKILDNQVNINILIRDI
jgi:hypothetical protein